MLFTELNTNVLLYIYGCLDPIDSINLAQTCTRLRDVAQLHYKLFKIFNLEHFIYKETNGTNQHRHNRIDAPTVLKHIGPFIRDLAADLDTNKIGLDVSTSIRKYCVNVKTLNIVGRPYGQKYDTAYVDWLRKLNLTKISLPIWGLFLIDLSETTTLHELHFHYYRYHHYTSVDYGRVANILERNVNISCLRIQLMDDFKYEIFQKLKCLKRLVLDINIEYDESGGQLEKVAVNLKMTTLEKLELNFDTCRGVDGLNEFLEKLSEKALHLKHLSIVHDYDMWDTCLLSSLHLLNLTSLRWTDEHPYLYKEIPKMQPNLTHLDLIVYEGSDVVLTPYIAQTLPKPMEQIIFLIKSLEKLELLHIRFLKQTNILSTLKDFLQESVLCRIFDCHSIKRPTVTLRLLASWTPYRFVQVELDFGARKWTWRIMKTDHFNTIVGHPSKLPFYDSSAKTIDDLLAVQRFSGTVSDLNAVKDEAEKWIEGLMCA